MPNAFAFFMIFSWPVVALLVLRRYPLPVGLLGAVFGGFLLLPTGTAIDLPVLPPFDKTMSAISAALLLVVFDASSQLIRRHKNPASFAAPLSGVFPRAKWALLCIAAIVFGTLITTYGNTNSLTYGPRTLRGLTLYDGLSAAQGAVILIVPWLLARKYLSCEQSQKLLLQAFVLAAALYALPALFEVRMSPQLNQMIYGFFPHSFAQHWRSGGYRPVVFMTHGLVLSLFLTMGYLASASLIRLKGSQNRTKFIVISAFLLGTLVLSKSLGALIVAVTFSPVILFFSARVQLLVAAAITVLVLSYPVLRSTGAFPVGQLIGLAENIDAGRAASLAYRFRHEDYLLEKANQKPVYGWGGGGRSRIYNARGGDASVTDGAWIIVLGSAGWIGYLGIFGLLGLPVLFWARRIRGLTDAKVASALSLVLAANFVDLIPNSGLTVLTWLVSGSLAGRLERARTASDLPREIATGVEVPVSPVLFSPQLRSKKKPVAKSSYAPVARGEQRRKNDH